MEEFCTPKSIGHFWATKLLEILFRMFSWLVYHLNLNINQKKPCSSEVFFGWRKRHETWSPWLCCRVPSSDSCPSPFPGSLPESLRFHLMQWSPGYGAPKPWSDPVSGIPFQWCTTQEWSKCIPHIYYGNLQVSQYLIGTIPVSVVERCRYVKCTEAPFQESKFTKTNFKISPRQVEKHHVFLAKTYQLQTPMPINSPLPLH